MSKTARTRSSKRWLYLPGGAILILLLLFTVQAFSFSNSSQIPLPGAIISGKDVELTGNAKVRGDIYTREEIKTSGNAQLVGFPRSLTTPFPIIDFDYYKEKAKQEGTYQLGDFHLSDKKPIPPLIFVEGNLKISANQTINATIIAMGKIEVSGNSDILATQDRLTLVATKDIKLSGKGSINGVVFSQEGKIELSGDRSVSGVLIARNGVKLSGSTKAIDSYPPVPPTFSQPPSPTNNPNVILAGTAEAYSSVQLWDGTNLIGTTEADDLGLYSTNVTLSEGFHTLASTSTDNCGNRSLPSEEREVLVDITPPTVNILSPQVGEKVLRTVTISVEAYDNFGLEKVELYIDSSLKKTWLSSPYTYQWDTTLYENGPHTIIAKAYDLAANQATDSITVEVANNIITPEGGTFTSSDGEVTLDFPAGAVSETIMLFYTPKPPQPVEGFSSTSHFFILEAYTLTGQRVTTLNKPVTITVYTIDPAARQGIGLYRFDEGSSKWLLIPSSHLIDDSVVATIDRLSLLALLSDTEAPVIQDKAPSGLIYTFRPTISAKVSDRGSGIRSSTIVLKLDGKTVSATYNSQTGEVTYTPTSNLSYGRCKVELSASDEAGNTTTSTWNFTVYGTPVSGTIYQDTTWTAEESPYIVTSSVTVYVGATLTIEPGTIVKFTRTPPPWQAPTVLWVSGTLIAEGGPTEKVIFTSLLDDSYGGDTNGDGAATTPSPGDWGCIHFDTRSPDCTLANAIVKYGGRPWSDQFQGAINIGGSSLSITNSVISDSGRYGIYSKDSSVAVSNSQIVRSARQGIYSYTYWRTNAFSLTNSYISNNGGTGAYLEAQIGAFDHNRIENNNGWAATLYGSLPSNLDTNFISRNKNNALALQGTLRSGNHTWSSSLGGAYVIAQYDYSAHLEIPSSATLTIKPGTVVKFIRTPSPQQPPARLSVSGTLIAEGTPTEKVVFTSLLDDLYGGDTNGDGPASAPAPGDWGNIWFWSSSLDSRLTNVVVKYGGRVWGDYGAIGTSSSSLSINNSTVTDSGSYGIYIRNCSPVISYCNVSNNKSHGIYAVVDSPQVGPTITYSTLSDNSGMGFSSTPSWSYATGSINFFEYNRIENNADFAARIDAGNLPPNLDTNFISGNKKNALALHGTLRSGDHIWSPSLGGVYLIYQSVYTNLYVPSDATLTIKPGTVVKFSGREADLLISGRLIAEGSAMEKIAFTSFKDDSYGGDSNGDGSVSSAARGDWSYIMIGGGSTSSRLSNAIVKYGGGGLRSGEIIISSGSPVITGSFINNSGNVGIFVESGSPHINSCDIQDNASYNLYNAGSTKVDAEYNWWGQAKGVQSKISGNVDYDPWALMPHASGVAQDRYGSETPCGYFGEPVNTAIGNYTYSHEDLKIEGRGLPLTIARAYNSLDTLYNGPFGYAWTFNYNLSLRENSDGLVLILKDDGRRDTYVKTPDGGYSSPSGVTDKLTKNADGSFALAQKDQTKYNFDPDGKLSSLEDKNANRTSLTYDSAKKLIKVADPSGRTIFLTYDSSAHITKITDPLGREYRYSYDTNGDLTTYTDPKGGVTRYTYSGHRITSVTDLKGQRFVENIYDAEGRVAKQYDALGNLFTFSYDKASYRTTLTDPKGNSSVHQYDAQYKLIYETDALGATTSYTYDWRGNRDSVKDKNGNTTQSIFDANGNIPQITDASGNTTLMTYDEKNNLTSKRDPLGNTTHFGYDGSGNLTSIIDPLSNVTTLAYDSYGKPISVTDASSNTTSFEYDEYGNQTRVRDALGNETLYAYDMVGRKTQTTDPKGHAAKFSYDLNNNLAGVEDATSHTASYAYDANNLLSSVTDPNGHITSYQYDAMDNLTGVMDPIGNITRYTYDGNYNRSSLTDANSKTTNYIYDQANRLIKIDYPEGVDTSFTYDAQGNRTSMMDSTGTTSYSYDALNRLISITHPSGKTVSYSYDANGRRISMGDPSGTTSYSYDQANRLISLRDPTNAATSFEYNPVGLRTKTLYPNGVSANYSYNANNQLTLLENKKSTGEMISSFSYEYDIDGQRTKMVEVDGSTTTYTYDELHRLTKEEKEDALGNVVYSSTYTYDPAGNRLTRTDKDGNVINYTYDAANRIQTAGQTTYAFDNNGNMAGKTTSQGTTTYSYDLENRLTNVALPDGSANSFAYDGDGKRVRKTTPAGDINYLYDGMSVIEEADQTGTLIASYTTDPTALIGQIISRKDSAGQLSYYSYDGIGSTRNLTDSSQSLVASYIYDSFGNLLSSPDTVQPYKFSTKEQDNTGLYYFGARYYDAEIGRFVTRDPVLGNLEDPQSLNPYVYCENDPIDYFDFHGGKRRRMMSTSLERQRFERAAKEYEGYGKCVMERGWESFKMSAGLWLKASEEPFTQPATLKFLALTTAGTAGLTIGGAIDVYVIAPYLRFVGRHDLGWTLAAGIWVL